MARPRLLLGLVLVPAALAAFSARSAFLTPTGLQHRLRTHRPLLRPAPAVGPRAALQPQLQLQQTQQLNSQQHRLPLPPALRRRGGAFRLEPEVVKASLTAVAELLISCGIGAFATRKGVLDRTVISSLSKCVPRVTPPIL